MDFISSEVSKKIVKNNEVKRCKTNVLEMTKLHVLSTYEFIKRSLNSICNLSNHYRTLQNFAEVHCLIN